MKKTVCELFAGVGGFRLGLERESKEWKTVWFSQWEPGKKKQWAHDCYVGHWGDIDDKTGIDIALVDKKNIPDHNLLVGGFPCQDYSVARPLPGAKGLQGKKGVLWWQIRDTLEAKKAPFALFENVDRLLKSPASQRGRDFGVILACLANLNYSVEWRVINAADYGAAQRRRRTFIFAYKNDSVYGLTQQWSKNKKNSKKDILSLLNYEGFFARAFPIEKINEEGLNGCTLNFNDIPDISDNFKFQFENSGYMTQGKVFTAKVTPVYEVPRTIRSLIEKNVPDKYFLVGDTFEKWKYLKGAKHIERTSKDGHKYIFSEGAIAFPDSIDKPARTMLTSESSLNRSTHVIMDPDRKQMRLITPVEAERIQGFDDNWTGNVGMPERFRYFCMGNALVVPLITRMGKILDEIFANEN